MCIRDSLHAWVQHGNVHDYFLTCSAVYVGALALASYRTVSYTHLDVYKRQDIAFTIDRNVYRGRASLSISIQEIRSHREM